MTATDPYSVLGVSPEVDEQGIRTAYRALMKRYHPDQNPSVDAADRAREVAAAYKLLSNPEERARHDRQRTYREQVIAPPPPLAPRAAPKGLAGGLLLLVISIGIIGFTLDRLGPGEAPVQALDPVPPSRLT